MKELDKRPLIESVVGLRWASGELAGCLRITESLAVEFLDSVWRLRVLEQHLRLIEAQTVDGAILLKVALRIRHEVSKIALVVDILLILHICLPRKVLLGSLIRHLAKIIHFTKQINY